MTLSSSENKDLETEHINYQFIELDCIFVTKESNLCIFVYKMFQSEISYDFCLEFNVVMRQEIHTGQWQLEDQSCIS